MALRTPVLGLRGGGRGCYVRSEALGVGSGPWSHLRPTGSG